MLLDGAVQAPALIRFTGRLVQEDGCKVFLVLGNLPVHRVRPVKDWLAERATEIEVFRPTCRITAPS